MSRITWILCAAVAFALAALVPDGLIGHDSAAAAPVHWREVPRLRSATSRTFRGPGGHMRTELHATPINYRDGRGWRAIDSRIVPTSGAFGAAGLAGRFGGYAYRNAANAWQSYFKDVLGDRFLELRLRDVPLDFTLEGANASMARVQGHDVTFARALPDTALTETVAPGGVKETLRIGSANAPSHFAFRLSAPPTAALTAHRLRGGAYGFDVQGGRSSFVITRPFAVDARHVKLAGGRILPPPRASHAALHVTHRGGEWRLVVDVDRHWLSSPKRTFPVTVDPSISVQGFKSASWYADCSVCAAWDSGYLDVGPGDGVYRSAVQFDLSGVPTGANVTSATLGLDYIGGCVPFGDGCEAISHQIDVHRLTAAWTAASTSQQFTFDPTPAASATLAANASPGWMTWNLTSLVRSWAAGTFANNGILLKRATEPSGVGGPSYVGATNLDYDPSLRPKLDVTWSSDAVVLAAPSTLHANGAELHWGQFDGSTGSAFDRYEIHRSKTAGFTPSASTLVATIRDPATVAYTDTTAAPGQTFSYRIVTNGTASSNEQRVTLPAAGTATTFLQPDYATGRDTAITQDASTGQGYCENNGGNPQIFLGSSGGFTYRPLLWFDVSGIAAKAHINSATLSLYAERQATVPVTVEAHGVTSDWLEGDGTFSCWTDGATWDRTRSDSPWERSGGDFDAASVASKAHGATDAPGWDSFNISPLVQKWVDSGSANFGVLLKATDESWVNGKIIYYDSSDLVTSPAQRPKLAVNYADTAPAAGPRVAVANPSGGSTVTGTQTIDATAADDGRVTGVDFYVDGTLKGSDATAPYSYGWASSSASDGSHTLTAKATDDAGNVTTSNGVNVTVANSAPPSTAITSHSDAYAQTVKNDGPSAYWRLGDTSGTAAADASGNGRSGTYAGSYTLGQAGLLTGDADKAVAFANAATDGKLTASVGTILSGSLTAEAWVSSAGVTTAGADDRIVSRNWGSSGGWMLALQKNTSGQQLATFAINRSAVVTSASSVVTTGKHHLAGTWDGTTMRLYVDGAQKATATPGAVTLNTTASVLLAQTLDTNATIDDVALYGKALGATAIANHFEVGSGRTPIVSGDVPVTASASDDGTVAHVEFYVDGTRFGDVTTAPWAATLKTLDPDAPVYDGTHTLTTKAYDNQGKVTQSAGVDVRVANTAGSRYQLTMSSSAAPQAVVWDPSATTQQASGLTVHVVNASTQTLSATDVVLRYRWLSPDPSVQRVDGPDVPLPANLAPNASADVTVMVQPPALPDGVDRAQYDLQVDAYEKSTGTYFAAKGNKPVDNPVVVNRKLADDLGLERWFHYEGEDIGAGMQHLVNVANGNSLLRWSPWAEPGVGLATVMDVTYNSLEKKSESPLGNNFSLSISSLSRWGNPIDIHPNNADSIAGRSNKYVDVVDGDGTTLHFTGQQAADGSTYWTEPAGVHLYLRRYSTTDATKAWAITRPDRVTYFYDDQGYPTSVRDANGNTITFQEDAVAPGDDPGGPKKHITKVTDAAGQGASPAPNRSWTIAYYTKADAKKPQIRGKIKQITEHDGDALRFDYYEDGNLLRITQAGGHKANGAPLGNRTFVFTYTTSNGDAAAIPAASDRVDPDPKTPNESTRLYSVRDPRGHETTFEYLGSGNGTDRWKLAARTERDGTRTTWAYDTTARATTQTEPLGRVTQFRYDAEGKPTSIINPNNETTTMGWTGDREVKIVTEPSGRAVQYEHNDNGYLTAVTDEASHRTELTYQNVAVDGNDVTGKWASGRTIPHVSQLQTLTQPRGVATPETTSPTDFEWLFGYDANGNLQTVTDPEDRATNGKQTTYTYNPDGTVRTVTDPNTHVTTYESYDANGLPTSVLDAKQERARFGYDDAGQMLWAQDPNHASSTGGTPQTYRTYLYYDSFHRFGLTSRPKSTAQLPGVLLWRGADYDDDDNVTSESAPHQGTVAGDPGGGSVTTHSYDAMDRVLEDVGPDHTVDPAGERTDYRYDDAGRLTRLTGPKGVRSTVSDQDFATFFDYDSLDRVTTQTRYVVDATGAVTKTLRQFNCYDIAGDLRSITTPEAHVASVTCAPYAGASNTFKFDYFADHRLQQRTDPDGHVVSQTFDEDGNLASTTDELRGRPVQYRYNQRDQVTKAIQPFDDGATPRDVTTQRTYDPAGNVQTVVSARGTDAGNGDYVTTYAYDAVDQPVLVTLPKNASTPQLYIHEDHDANGNQTMVTPPVTTSDPTAVPAAKKTQTRYYDPGWVLSVDKPGVPKSTYDYTAEGWQTSRTATGADGTSRDSHWTYYPDGMVQSMTGRDKQVDTYTYDEDNDLRTAKVASGSHDASQPAIDITANYDGLDRLASTEERRSTTSNVRVTSFSYDDDGNRTEAIENAVQGPNPDAGRTVDYFFTPGDRIDHVLDHGKDSSATALADDRRVTYHLLDNGWPKDRTVEANGSAFTTKQTTAWTWFDNGELRTMVTKNGAGAVRESHTLSYVDGNSQYVDGNPVNDTFRLTGPDSTKPCQTADCTVGYTYDALDRVTREVRVRGGNTRTIDYGLNDAGDVTTLKVNGSVQRTFSYNGDQIDLESDGGGQPVGRYFYDAFGDLSCVTSGTTDRSVCDTWDDASRSSQLRLHANYDALDRMLLSETYDTQGRIDRSSRYVYDPLNRPASRVELNREGSAASDATLPQATTAFTYLGLTDDVTGDRRTASSTTETRDYTYGAGGDRLAETFQRGANSAKDFYIGHDARGDVSQLLDNSGNAQAAYAYEAYGVPDTAVTDERDADTPASASDKTDPQDPADPLNPYRFQDKRTDRGSGTVDMGARRFATGTATFAGTGQQSFSGTTHFLQADEYDGALDDLGLEQDTLTQNRYGLSGANPISFIDQDGHRPIDLNAKQTQQWSAQQVKNAANSTSASSGGGTTGTAFSGTLRTPGFFAPGIGGVAENRISGLEFQRGALEALGLKENHETIESTDVNGRPGRTRPDGLQRTTPRLKLWEMKNTIYQSMTRQLRLQMRAGDANLVVAARTRLSRGVKQAMARGILRVVRYHGNGIFSRADDPKARDPQVYNQGEDDFQSLTPPDDDDSGGGGGGGSGGGSGPCLASYSAQSDPCAAQSGSGWPYPGPESPESPGEPAPESPGVPTYPRVLPEPIG